MQTAILLSSLLAATNAVTAAAETVVGAFIFSRHGDRTAKALAPANLTDLGYVQVYQRGQYYRSRYLDADSDAYIAGIATDLVRPSQLDVSAPADVVLGSSALGFLQGLYPPAGAAATAQTLANGSTVEAPLNGYQLIPVSETSGGSSADAEDTAWLQSTDDCTNAVTSSAEYYNSSAYLELLESTKDFYTRLLPVVNATFSADEVTFKNAYTVFDLINVATIHNTTIPSSSLLDDATLFQLRTLADAHEWGLAYNASSPIRAMAGMELAAEILDGLNTTVAGAGAQKLTIQFGSYGTFLSFFGLAKLPAASVNFTGIPDYASTMVFELFTNASTSSSSSSSSSFPATEDLHVRFLFHNGSAAGTTTAPTVYPLFNTTAASLPWSDFVTHMQSLTVASTADWCSICGVDSGSTCAAYSNTSSSSTTSSSSGKGSGNGSNISPAVGGVIGAMVTLAVVLITAGLAAVLGGWRVVSTKRLRAMSTTAPSSVGSGRLSPEEGGGAEKAAVAVGGKRG